MTSQSHSRSPWGSTTPWGSVQTSREIANGIWSLTTAGHGGFWLSPERVAEIRGMFPEFVPFAGWPWLEEDCDVSVAVLVWPHLFDAGAVLAAVQSVRSMSGWPSCGQKWASVADRIPAAVAAIADAEERRLLAADAWQFAGLCSGHFREPWVDCWAVSWRHVGSGATCYKLMPYPEQRHYSTADLAIYPEYCQSLHDMPREEIAARGRQRQGKGQGVSQ